jgi:hypothetical protein
MFTKILVAFDRSTHARAANAMPPGIGGREANVASSETSDAVLMTPKQFGPTTRMPPTAAGPVRRACRYLIRTPVTEQHWQRQCMLEAPADCPS